MGYEPIETASVDELRSLQSERLKATTRNAYDNIAHYRDAFDAKGVHPDDIGSIDDLSKLPFLLKDDLRAAYPFGMFAVPRTDLIRVHASSGTTGKPTVVGYTKNDVDVWATVVARSLYAAGGRPGDIVHVAFGYGLFTGGLGAHYGAEKLGCTVVPMGGGQTEKQVTLIVDFEPDILMVTPSYCLNLIDELERQGFDPSACSLKVGLFGAEPWTEGMRSLIESRMGIDAVDLYGLSEVIGPGVAQECVETKDGLTVWEDHFYPEIIDPDSGETLPDGEQGELVLTSLTKEALPIIRYRTRDITTLMPGTARTMRRMARVTGRSDDMLIIRGVNVYPSHVEHELMKIDGLSAHYQLHKTVDGNMAGLRVKVEAESQVDDETAAGLAAKARARIKTMVGISSVVEVVAPFEVPRSEGKAQRVV